MNILFVDQQLPMPDRASADVRMFSIVRIMRELGHACSYLALDLPAQKERLGAKAVAAYAGGLERLGVRAFSRVGFDELLERHSFDLVYFKYFYPAERRIAVVRVWMPKAVVVVDSVDLVYARLRAKARSSGRSEDAVEAEQIRSRELTTYSAADAVITVTEDERAALGADLPDVPVHVIPNIHEIPEWSRNESEWPSLLFIGVFSHEPNVDAVLFFAREIWPQVQREVPGIRWTIVGGNIPPEIAALDGNGIEVVGYVPDTRPYLERSWISIAPLRFGAGMKGKVGEAMAAGLPVVTTSFGAEGFGLREGEHLLVADNSRDFATQVAGLARDSRLRSRLGVAGKCFIEQRYSPAAVKNAIGELFARPIPIRSRAPLRTIRRRLVRAKLALDRNLLWRFRS